MIVLSMANQIQINALPLTQSKHVNVDRIHRDSRILQVSITSSPETLGYVCNMHMRNLFVFVYEMCILVGCITDYILVEICILKCTFEDYMCICILVVIHTF